MKQLLFWGAAATAMAGVAAATSAFAQPVLQQRWPAANAVAAAPFSSVQAVFSPVPGGVGPTAPLWVYSARRGGRRTGHSGQLLAAGGTLLFRPTYPFQPGEVIYATTWAARTASQPGAPQLWQFTAAVGGTGQGNFLPGLDLPSTNLAHGLAVGDVDGDGDLDLLTTSISAAGGQVRVRLNGGDASGTGAGHYDAGTLLQLPHPAASLALADVDGDGDLDLLTGSDSADTVRVHLNGGDASGSSTGHFSGGMAVPMDGCATPLSLALGDVDGDGDLDLLAANSCGAGTVQVRLNGGDASGTNTGIFSGGGQVAVGSNPFDVVLGDVDGDGDLDLLTANLGGTVSVRLNGGNAAGAGTGHFSSGAEITVGQGSVGLALADVDSDGDLDLLTANFGTGTVSLRLNGGNASGSNTGQFSGGLEIPVGLQPQRLALADVDHDGDLDLLATCTGAGTVSVRLNGGDALGAGAGHFSGGSDPAVGTAPVGLAVADIDGDGDLDLLTASPTASQVSVRLNQPWRLEMNTSTNPADSSRLAAGLLVQAYPNPAGPAQTLRICTDQAGPATLLLVDVLGRQLSQQQLALPVGTTTLPLASDLSAGMYLLRVQQGARQQTIRVVRQ